MLTKQAKVLTDQQIKAVLKYLESCPRNSLRNRVMFMLSLHGLRAKEIANIRVSMIVDCTGLVTDTISLEDRASKGSSGRTIPINKALREMLTKYIQERPSIQSPYVIITERAEKFSANAISVYFKRLYSKLGFVGCSSHSGRRTFITNCARKISQTGGSLRDVMNLAGHRQLQTTQKYIEQNGEAQRSVVNILYPNV